MQTSALSAGLHMLHHQADGCVHPRLRAGQLHRMAEFGRGLQRAYMRGVALGVEHMKDHLAFGSHAIGLRRAAVQHRHGFGAKHGGFLAQAAWQRYLALHHGLAQAFAHKTLEGQFLPEHLQRFGGAGALLFQKIHAFIRHHDSS